MQKEFVKTLKRNFLSAPQLAWQAASKKKNDAKLELLSDVDVL